MTAATVTLPAGANRRPGAPARRAVLRWAFRMFRRDWRSQALILGLLVIAVAATTVGLAVITNVAELHADPSFGTANTIVGLRASDSGLTADLAAMRARFGPIDVVDHQSIPVPGSVSTIDVRAADPHGPFVGSTLRLDSGRYPASATEVAVTKSALSEFDLRVGGVWNVAGNRYTVVGVVENPLDLSDDFALVAPGALKSPTNISVLLNAPGGRIDNFRLPSGTGLSIQGRGTTSVAAIEGTILAMSTLALLFVGLLAVAGFAVVAQRRMRALGMLSAVGANDRSVRLVLLANGAAVGATAAVAGGALGFVIWLGVYRWVQSTVAHRISPFDLPWVAIGIGLVLACVTSILAAWWPARAAARMPVVAALSGRPPKRQPAHRFAAAGVVVLAGGLTLLAFAEKHHAAYILSGTIASVVGVLLLAPLAIQGVARLAGRAPIALRLALRDLARYQARSGAALGAATLAIAIASTIAISAAAAEQTGATANLPDNEIVLYIGTNSFGPGAAIPVLSADQSAAVQRAATQIASTLNTTAVPLEAPYNPNAPVQVPGDGPPDQVGGRPPVNLAHVVTQGNGIEIDNFADITVATPQVLAALGVDAHDIAAKTEFISARTDLGNMEVFDPTLRDANSFPKPTIQRMPQLPTYGSDPTVLITPYGLQKYGLTSTPRNYLFRSSAPLTAAQIDSARRAAAQAGVAIETHKGPKSLVPLRNWATVVGIIVALGVLAMTVGLIRSEAGRDLSTLSATGASSWTRRTITGATTGTLALLGAVLGTAGAYAALTAWFRSDLHPLTQVPWLNLVLIVIALPLIATATGWLLAGRDPATTRRQPLE